MSGGRGGSTARGAPGEVQGVRVRVLDVVFFFQAEDGIRDLTVTGVQTCALPISTRRRQGGSAIPTTRFGGCAARACSRGGPTSRSRWDGIWKTISGGRPSCAPRLEIGRASCRGRV